jgi:hypothetical protein
MTWYLVKHRGSFTFPLFIIMKGMENLVSVREFSVHFRPNVSRYKLRNGSK